MTAPLRTIPCISPLFSGGYTTSMPHARTAIVLPFAASAPLCACVSMPRAIPLTTVKPAEAISDAIRCVTVEPVMSRFARSDDRNASRLPQASLYIKEKRRVRRSHEAAGICLAVGDYDLDSGIPGSFQFLFRVFSPGTVGNFASITFSDSPPTCRESFPAWQKGTVSGAEVLCKLPESDSSDSGNAAEPYPEEGGIRACLHATVRNGYFVRLRVEIIQSQGR